MHWLRRFWLWPVLTAIWSARQVIPEQGNSGLDRGTLGPRCRQLEWLPELPTFADAAGDEVLVRVHTVALHVRVQFQVAVGFKL